MSNFMFSLNATLPVFLVIVLGWFLMQKKMFNENFVDIINKFVFKVSLPVLLFKDIATTPIRDAFTRNLSFSVWLAPPSCLWASGH